ncbi:hypothetical protein AWC03_08685 [Mycobacterium europaeum]|uniref:hypothetical protein n=1 Tax=Mycobacterium europaeum TaxID=761804 RepID=UPI000A1645BF|nr:hypothetical protein [Mycobacterium europaeum]ORV61700.1 hypothetical protein AWC03_08685 [Mycobacterium europaeum]
MVDVALTRIGRRTLWTGGRPVEPQESQPPADPDGNFDIAAPSAGALADLAPRPLLRRNPRPGGIEHRIERADFSLIDLFGHVGDGGGLFGT